MTIIPEDEAAWIRTNVWPVAMRKTFAEVPGMFTSCACEYGLTSWCQNGQCERCHRAEPQPGPAGYVCGRTGEDPMYFGEPYEHPTISATGRHKTQVAMFWLADRVCRWICPCSCHDIVMEQGVLFDLEVSA